MWFQAKLLSFYSNLCRTYEFSQNPLELKHKKIPSSISALSACGLVLYSSSPFQRCAQLFLEPNIRREATSWIGWPYGSPVVVIIVVAVVLTSLCHRYIAIKPVLWCQCYNSITMLLDFVHSNRYQLSSSSSVSSRCESDADRPSRYDTAGILLIRNNEMKFFPFFSPPFSSFLFFFFLLFSSFSLFLSPPFFYCFAVETQKKSHTHLEKGRLNFSSLNFSRTS